MFVVGNAMILSVICDLIRSNYCQVQVSWREAAKSVLYNKVRFARHTSDLQWVYNIAKTGTASYLGYHFKHLHATQKQ